MGWGGGGGGGATGFLFKQAAQVLASSYIMHFMPHITTTKLTSLQVLIGTNLVIEAGMLLYITPNQGADAQVIVPAVLIPVLFILLGSIAVVVFIVLVFRRKIKAKELEQQDLTARMSDLTSGGNRDGLAQELMKQLPVKLIIPSADIKMLDFSLGKGELK